ncbi:cytochrome P450 [Mycena maculata]|uniref:Cytochrome P450 n=1 Tax=Mycena maculata TaxID=230809 RepID=A0AAD7JGD5_9AGAR|nr:cytochrome P450 [Mycena maculata]
MIDYLPSSFLYRAALVPVVFLGSLLAFFVFLFVVASLKAHTEASRVPAELPWVGRKNELFGSLKANWRGLWNSIALYLEGYGKFSKSMGVIHVVPTWGESRGPQIMLPPSMGHWLAHMPEEVLNAKNCTFYNEITNDDMIDLIIRRELTRTTGTLNPELLEDIEDSYVRFYGGDGEWRSRRIYHHMGRIVARVANRAFVGKELCSNDEYLDSANDFAMAVGVSGIILHFFPKFMRPAVAWFVTIPNRRASGISMKYLQPLIKQRIVDMRNKEADPTYPWEEPNDFITWMVRESFKRTGEHETSVYGLAYRIVLLNFAAITTTTITVTNAILDIWSSPPSQNVVAILREEAERVYAEHSGEWTKAAIAKLVRLDSAIRESARISSIGGAGMARRTKRDVTLPNGLVIPKDNCIGVAMHGLHFDEDHYPSPHQYDAFRFSRPREEAALLEKTHTNEDLVTTSVHWLPFGHGLHACSGRFFAANNVKLMLAHLLINYEIQPFDVRPVNPSMSDMQVVPRHAEMVIRRRVKA